jgi:hypothetical protein
MDVACDSGTGLKNYGRDCRSAGRTVGPTPNNSFDAIGANEPTLRTGLHKPGCRPEPGDDPSGQPKPG